MERSKLRHIAQDKGDAMMKKSLAPAALACAGTVPALARQNVERLHFRTSGAKAVAGMVAAARR
jgi:hypothetical protein